jgi:hypothetical protein
MLVESFCRLAMDPSGNSVPQKLCNFVARSLFLSLWNIIASEVSSVFYLLSSTTIWHPQWRGFTCTTSLKKKWNLESSEEDLLICATWMFSGSMSLAACRMDLMFVRSEKNMVSCTMRECCRSVYYYLSPSSPLPRALTTLLPPAAPISQAHTWRSGWAPRQMSASPWVVFWVLLCLSLVMTTEASIHEFGLPDPQQYGGVHTLLAFFTELLSRILLQMLRAFSAFVNKKWLSCECPVIQHSIVVMSRSTSF